MKTWRGMDSPEWERGDTAQRQWAEMLRKLGHAVLPAYAFDDVVPETKAPVMLVPDGVRITPDVLSLHAGQSPEWHEIKSKTVPTWHRNLGRWEHGCDYSLACEYRKAQEESGVPVYLVVYESATPADAAHESPTQPSGIWLWIGLDDALAYGDHRCDWPGGKAQPHRRGRAGQGGLLWPRERMLEWPPTPLQQPIAAREPTVVLTLRQEPLPMPAPTFGLSAEELLLDYPDGDMPASISR